jgi:predicted metal-dependent hydrolase
MGPSGAGTQAGGVMNMLFLFRGRRRRMRLRRRRIWPAPRLPAEGDAILHQGGIFKLRIISDLDRPQGCVIDGLFFDANLHDPVPGDNARREEARLEILLWHKKQARRIFQERVDFWAAHMGVKYRRLAPSNPRRQWGSCSAQNDIRLNWRLIMAPPALLDYVIVHELCHITHKNHSKRFWNAVARLMPDWKTRRKELHKLDPGA